MTQIGHKNIMTIMLQHRYKVMSFLVLALAAPGIAFAQTTLSPVSYTQVLETSEKGSVRKPLDLQLLQIANDVRSQSRLDPLQAHPGLAEVAQAHARDMATKGYVGYVDPTGASLFDQVRISERSALIGSFGSSIAVLEAGATAAEIHEALQSDTANAENLQRAFSHAGMGSYVHEGRVYVVHIFAKIDGELDDPLPLQLAQSTILRTALATDEMTPVAWSLTDGNGDLLARGNGRRLQTGSSEAVEGYLNLDVALGNDIYTLRGPFVELN